MEAKLNDVVENAWQWADSVVQPAVTEIATLLGLPTPQPEAPVRSVPNVLLPYFGETSLDVVIFVGSAFVFQCSLWWKRFLDYRRQRYRKDDRSDEPSLRTIRSPKPKSWWEHQSPPAPEVRSTVYKPYKDESLHAFMGEVMEQKTRLRHVDEDAALQQRQKLREARLEQLVSSASNGLGLSQRLLQDTRAALRETGQRLDD